jgi:hypothetical protein
LCSTQRDEQNKIPHAYVLKNFLNKLNLLKRLI